MIRDVLHVDQVTGAFNGSYVILSGEGDLSRMRGDGRFQGNGGVGLYAGHLSLAPGDQHF
jgi:hypothetical protein